MNNNKITFEEYCKAFNQLKSNAGNEIPITVVKTFFDEDGGIHSPKIIWPSLGAVSLDRAEEFCSILAYVIDLCKEFNLKYQYKKVYDPSDEE